MKRSLTLTLLAFSLIVFANLAEAASRPFGDLRRFAAGGTPSAVGEPCVPSPDCVRAWDSYDRLFYEGTRSGVEVTQSQGIPSVHLVTAVKSGTITFTHDVGATVQATALTATYNSTPPPGSVILEARSSDDGQTYSAWFTAMAQVPSAHVLQVRATLKRVNGTSPDIRSITLRAQPSDYCRGLGGSYVSCYGTGHPETLGTKNMIAIRVHFANEGPWDLTRNEAWARSKMAQLDSWLRENSYDQMRLNGSGGPTCCGDVYPQVVSMPVQADPCNYSALSRAVLHEVDPLIDLHNYNYVWFIRQTTSCQYKASGSTGSNWLGMAEGYDLSQRNHNVFLAYQWNDYDETFGGGMHNGLMHEFEHGLWTSHSDYPHGHTRNCFGCDSYDVMGSGFYAGAATDTNAVHKEMIGWLKPPRIMTVTQSGTFTIEASELQTGALKVLKVSLPNIEPVYVELRKLIGFDVGLTPANPEGVVLHRIVPGYPFGAAYDNYLINPHNTDDDINGYPQDVVLRLNQPFPIPGTTYTITLLPSTVETEARLQVSTPVSR